MNQDTHIHHQPLHNSPAPYPPLEEEDIHLRDYFRVLVRRKWLILITLAVIVLLALVHNNRLQPIYSATATLIIDRESNKSPLTGQRVDYETYMSESLTFNTHFELIKSRPVMERVVRKLKLDQPGTDLFAHAVPEEPSFIKQAIGYVRAFVGNIKRNLKRLLKLDPPPPPEQDPIVSLSQIMQGMITIIPVEETRLLNIMVTSPLPQVAKEVANATAQAYIEFNLENRVKSSNTTLTWLSDNLYEVKKKLEDAEQAFIEYKQSVNLISLEDSQRVSAQKISEFNDAYIAARNQRLELDTRIAKLEEIVSSGKEITSLRTLLDNQLIDSLYAQLVKLEVERSRLAKVYKAKHPKMVAVNTDIENTLSKLEQEVRKEVENLKAKRVVLASKEKVLQKTMDDFEAEAMESNKNTLKYTMLKRDVDVNQGLYDTLLARMKEADISDDIDVSNIRITEPATLPVYPVGPNKKRNLLLAIVLGLMLGIGSAFLLEYMDRSLHTEEDVKNHLNLPVLAVIPKAGKLKATSKHKRIPADKAQSVRAEAN